MDKRIIFIAAVVLVIAFIIVFAIVSSFQRPSRPTQPGTPITRPTNIPVNTIVNEPLAFDGLTVDVESNVSFWVTKKSFYLTAVAGGLFSGQTSNLLIISRNDFKLPKDASATEIGIGERFIVHVTGQARIVDKQQLGELLGLDLESKDPVVEKTGLTKWTKGIIIISDSVKRI